MLHHCIFCHLSVQACSLTPHLYMFMRLMTTRQTCSFEEADRMIQWVHRMKDESWVPIVLVGNKVDLEEEREVRREEGVELAQRYRKFFLSFSFLMETLAMHAGIPFFESSAKTRVNVEEAVHELIRITPRTGAEYRIVICGAGGVGV